MKRKASPAQELGPGPLVSGRVERVTDTSAGRPRRQPQISCDLCRHKKLKCDRTRPCSNCVARGQSCLGGPVLTSISGVPNSTEILERLRRLEQAVFSAKDGSHPRNNIIQDPGHATWETTVGIPSPPRIPTPSTELDYPSVGETVLSDAHDKCRFRLAEPMNPSIAKVLFRPEVAPSPSVLLPTKEDSLAMFDYFLHTSHCIPQTIHLPSARSTISDFYSQCFGAQSPVQRPASSAVAAFILSICATTAFFWHKHGAVSYRFFSSMDQAARQSETWLNAAWDLLDHSRRVGASGSIEEVQAFLVLSDLLYNMEGCSTRYRHLHNRALTISREISLHLTDAPSMREGAVDTDVIAETKRRVWWHIVSTDWLLSTMGGPMDRTYQVHPRHMIVNYPRNVNKDDMSNVLPPDTATDMTYFLLRTRLAEVCRKVVDSLPLGSNDIDGLPYDQVLAISQLFDDVLTSMPPSFTLDAPIQAGTPSSAFVDRRIINLAFHARIARIFRPFLLVPDEDIPGRTIDPRCSDFRSLCLRSARSVIKVASTLLQNSLEESAASSWPVPLMHRSGCVVSHMFMACVVLATDPRLTPRKEGNAFDSDAETIRRELSNARQLLERVGEKSPMAANLVSKLIGVLKRHSTHAVVPTRASIANGREEQHNSDPTITPFVQGVGVLAGTTTGNAFTDSGAAEKQGGWAEQQSLFPVEIVEAPEAAARELSWGLGGTTGYYNTNAPEGMDWAALMGNGLTDTESWTQLFADLDAAFPTSM